MVRIPDEQRDLSPTYEFAAVGQVLARRFELVREIARGGMGVVFEAVDQVLEGHRVALKLLPAEISSNRGARARLKGEALAAIELTHPNITRLHSYEEDGAHAFLVMEYLAGDTLEDRLAVDGPLAYEQALEVARAAAAALGEAHRRGVIHRDIKPANLMYAEAGNSGPLKVMDFGIAFRIRESMTRLTGLVSAGTLLYCPPEQLRNQPADARSDQYALAATLYELVGGEPPFLPPGLEHKILNLAPHPLQGVPEHFDRALRQALSKDPARRFADVGGLLAALEGAVEVPEPGPEDPRSQPDSTLAFDPSAGSPGPGEPGEGTGGIWAPGPLPWVIAGLSVLLAGAALTGALPPPFGPGSPPAPTPAPTARASALPTPSPSPKPAPPPEPVWSRRETAPEIPGERFVHWAGGAMRWVPPGRFRMGSEEHQSVYANQKPAHEVEVKTGFWLGETEVTQAEFSRVLGWQPSTFPGEQRPVESIIWNDARRFCRVLTEKQRQAGDLPAGFVYRLPTEAQWEYACRAGTRGIRYQDDVDEIAWYAANSDQQTQLVAKKLPNPWGFHDMLGNVWEYTLDRWHDGFAGAPSDERPWDQGDTHLRVLRGAAWGNQAQDVEGASRGRPFVELELSKVGFRVALVPEDLPTVPDEVTVWVRSTPPGAWLERPGLEGTLGRVGTLDRPLRLSLGPGVHPFAFKVFNQPWRTRELRVEPDQEDLGFWAILDPAAELEGERRARSVAEAEAALARADAELLEARAAADLANQALARGQQAKGAAKPTPAALEALREAVREAEREVQRAGVKKADAQQDLDVARRGGEDRVEVEFRCRPDAAVTNLDPWGNEDRLWKTWEVGRRLSLEAGASYTFRFRRLGDDADRYFPAVLERRIEGRGPVTVFPMLETRPAPLTGSQPGALRHNAVGMTLAWAPPEAELPGLWVGAHEVTESEYRRVMGLEVDPRAPFRRPVRAVSRDEATRFCERLTALDAAEGRLAAGWAYRLPRAPEWEHASLAGQTPSPRELEARAWLEANAQGELHEVGTLGANPWGLHDMVGNIEEWCAEGVAKGGSYQTAAAAVARSITRSLEPGQRDPLVGFRVVLAKEAP